jgi:hypothetical protein
MYVCMYVCRHTHTHTQFHFGPHRNSISKTALLMPYGKILVINCENHMKYTNKMCGQTADFSVLNLVIHIVTKM